VLIQWITIVEFRSYSLLSFKPDPGLNVLSGPNAQGKTNLLEAMGLLLVGRSFRGAKAADLPRWGATGASLSGAVVRGEVTREIRRGIAQREDGGWAVTGEGCPWARAIPFGWQDLAILTGGPQARRNFLDGFAAKVQPAHAAAHARYRQILGRRNYLLQRGQCEHLHPWNEQLAKTGVEILARRRQAVDTLEGEVARLYPELAGSNQRVRLEYRSALGPATTEGEFLEALAARREDEMRRRLTLVGPHRDDLVVELDGHDMRSFGSRGQQRLLVLALRLAEAGPVEAAVGSPAVLLLDDALSELDPDVQGRVLRHAARSGQVFLTTAEPGLSEGSGAAWWDVNGGVVAASPVAEAPIAEFVAAPAGGTA
jgi:DNA replication and repair protein RecF